MGIKNRSKSRLLALMAGLTFLVLTVPAQAALVSPMVVNHTGGGGEADCKAADVNSTAPNAFLVASPGAVSGQWVTDPATGAQFKVTVTGNSFAFEVRDDPNGPTAESWRVADVVAKGSRGSNWYDYDGSVVGPVTADSSLGTPQNKSLSHISFCFGPYYKVTGTKFHNRDTDVIRDDDNGAVEEGLPNWTVRAYSGTTLVGSAVTDATGHYEIVVPAGLFTVCEVLRTDLPAPFTWGQSFPNATTPNTASCPTGLAPLGHSVQVINADVTGKDFGNNKMVTLNCAGPLTATLSEPGKPSVTVSLTAGCQTEGDQVFPLDHGVTPDDVAGQSIDQFVVFGGSPSGNSVITQTITWQPYDVNYLGDGTLPIRPTLVTLNPGGQLQIGQNCKVGEPSATTVSDCRASRIITETADTADPPGDPGVQNAQVQETEVWKFLGDPTRGK